MERKRMRAFQPPGHRQIPSPPWIEGGDIEDVTEGTTAATGTARHGKAPGLTETTVSTVTLATKSTTGSTPASKSPQINYAEPPSLPLVPSLLDQKRRGRRIKKKGKGRQKPPHRERERERERGEP
ncbi:hypothetical protein CRG98_001384 [Punica granatum]|uniref:Uncharacterized protein n=1 Tax=Punica granatum TaxID=22663 RepID=A0A2I0LC08_PUNGR|nr:hypothetical protein CRG98_001384 [Punica granatum]